MKKIILTAMAAMIALTSAINSWAQMPKNTNVQLHYNWGNHLYKELNSERDLFVTLEHFSTDPWGANYGFVDIMNGANGIRYAYTELSRELKFWKAPISAHLEYNGGVTHIGSWHNVFLAGPSYAYANPAKSFGLTAMALYRHDHKLTKPHNFQFTGTWHWTSWNRLWTLNGFFDLWTTAQSPSSHMVVVAQPQFWLNLNQFVGVSDHFNLALGTEVQLSYNYVLPGKFYALPTAAIKWTF